MPSEHKSSNLWTWDVFSFLYIFFNFFFSSVQSLSCVWLFATPWIAACQASLSITQLPESTQTHVHWVSDAIQPSHPVVPFSSCPQSAPASGSFPMSQLFAWGGQSIGVTASISVLPMNTQGWSPLGWTGWIFLQSKGLSKVFSNTTVQKNQFFSAQLSSPSNSLHLAVVGLHCYTGFSLAVGSRAHSPAVMHRPLIVLVSLGVEHRL